MYLIPFFLRRLGHAAAILFCVVVTVVVAVRMIPGDPVEIMTAGTPGITEEQRQELRSQLGLDGSLLTQVVGSVQRFASGDMGESIRFRRSAAEVVVERLLATVELTFAAMFLALAISLPLGILAALFRGRFLDRVASAVSILGVSIPSFVLGVVLILFFSLHLKWFPVAGRGGQGLIFGLLDLVSGRGIQPLVSALRHLALPAFALAFSVVAWNTRLIRSSMIEVLKADYVRFARAKGLPEFAVVMRHAFRTALIPTITIVGLQMGYLLSGAFIVENVFAWPGIGRLAVQAVSWRDYPLIQAIVAVTAVMFLLINIAVEMLYQIADPRIRHAK